jgi:hypothetical protein
LVQRNTEPRPITKIQPKPPVDMLQRRDQWKITPGLAAILNVERVFKERGIMSPGCQMRIRQHVDPVCPAVPA